MYKINEIKELIRTLDRSSIDELTIKGEGKQLLSLRRNRTQQSVEAESVAAVQTSAAPVAPVVEEPKREEQTVERVEPSSANAVEEDATLHEITSPMVGTFYESPSPDAEPYVKVGDKVTAEKVVCIVEAMKLMNELEAEVEGEVVAILVDNGQLVEYGQPLFKVKTQA